MHRIVVTVHKQLFKGQVSAQGFRLPHLAIVRPLEEITKGPPRHLSSYGF
jgi:hypothetical protein